MLHYTHTNEKKVGFTSSLLRNLPEVGHNIRVIDASSVQPVVKEREWS
jgi:hypothetical protein